MRRAWHHLLDHFIPHARNNHHPHVLKHRVLVGYSVMLVLLKAIALIGSVALPSSSLYASAITAQNIITLTNQTREGLSIPTLQINAQLMQAARAKAEDMVLNGYFAHTSPAGVTPWSWIKATGYRYRYSAENLAVHFDQSEDVESGWMASPSHRANIVDPKYTETGVGVALGDFEGVPSTFVVQYFALPKVETPPVLAAPTTTAPVAVAPEEPEPVPTPTPAVTVIPKENRYEVQLTSASATRVQAQLAGKTTTLQKTPGTQTWTGTIAPEKGAISPGGEPLYVNVQTKNAAPQAEAVAVVAPDAPPAQLFGSGSPPSEVKLFGVIPLNKLDDDVHQVFVFFMLFLAVSLLINILVRFKAQKISVVAHASMVLLLAIILYKL